MMQSYNRFRARLIAELNDKPIEDGIEHPAEHVIEGALRANRWFCFSWLSLLVGEYSYSRPSIAASIIRCIGRLDHDEVGTWGIGIVQTALWNRNVEVREAGIRALEHWGGRVALHMLRQHYDRESWLSDYVSQVITDLDLALFGTIKARVTTAKKEG